jgi:hypothetical protein
MTSEQVGKKAGQIIFLLLVSYQSPILNQQSTINNPKSPPTDGARTGKIQDIMHTFHSSFGLRYDLYR